LETSGEKTLEIGEETVNLSLEDVEISTDDIPGWLVLSDRGITVALDIQINEELKAEGVARELVNRIQNIRKDSGLEVTDRIHIYAENHPFIEQGVNRNFDYICAETLADKLELVGKDKVAEGTTVEIEEGVSITVYIQKI
jgi:isoleucyl-tRNA synthetase